MMTASVAAIPVVSPIMLGPAAIMAAMVPPVMLGRVPAPMLHMTFLVIVFLVPWRMPVGWRSVMMAAVDNDAECGRKTQINAHVTASLGGCCGRQGNGSHCRRYSWQSKNRS